ncbi:AraC family transcriptional regulator [Thalassotalea insulae]|uniref:AraC family transcriptional regulator n=2 Tax=Thalassotalea insulae TaxID=2056778 RepID=A0ABQ6GUM2_9GAMM|nr:AraC family transcriptional regulator [Thalassotalea insulae]
MSLFLAKDFFRIVALLEARNQQSHSFEVEILTCGGEQVMSASHSLITPDGALSEKCFDWVIIPPVEGIRLMNMPPESAEIVTWLKPYIASNTSILTLSTGAYFLAASGMLNSVTFATHWAFVSTLAAIFPDSHFTAHQSYLKSKNVYTTGSFEAGIDVLLKLVAEVKGDRFSQLCATHLLLFEPQKLTPFLAEYRAHNDKRISLIQDWIDSNFQNHVLITELAKMFGFSERNIKRRFQKSTSVSIIRYLQDVRIDKAKKLLLSTEKSIKDVSIEVGYENDSFFSRLFKRSTGVTPAVWRKGS